MYSSEISSRCNKSIANCSITVNGAGGRSPISLMSWRVSLRNLLRRNDSFGTFNMRFFLFIRYP